MTDHTRDTRGAMTDEQRDSINSPFNACCNREACRALLAQSSAKTDDEIYDLFEKETGFSVESHATIEEADILGFARALLATPSLPAADGLTAPQMEMLRALLVSIRPRFGAAGSRDVEVAAIQRRIDSALEILAAPRQPGEVGAGVPVTSGRLDGDEGFSLRVPLDLDSIERECNEGTPPTFSETLAMISRIRELEACAGVRWDMFPAWLIDHCEGETITEEGLQSALADMLKVYPVTKAESAQPDERDGGQQ